MASNISITPILIKEFKETIVSYKTLEELFINFYHLQIIFYIGTWKMDEEKYIKKFSK